MEIDVQIKFFLGGDPAEGAKRHARWPPALEGIQNLPAARKAVTDVDLLFPDLCGGIAEGVQNSAPVWITAAPACFDQRAVCHRAGSGIGIGEGLPSGNANGHETRHPLAVAHD